MTARKSDGVLSLIGDGVLTDDRHRVATHWGGAAIVAGSIMLALAIVLVSLEPVQRQAFSPTVAALFLTSSALLLLGLPSMYAIQAGSGGSLALVAHVLLETGLLLLVVLSAAPLLYPSFDQPPGESPTAFLLGIALTLGLLLSGAAMLRAAVLPRGSGVLVIGAMVGFFFGFFVSENLPAEIGQLGNAVLAILLGAGFGSAGWAMWTGRLR